MNVGITRPGIKTKVRLLAPGIGLAVLITLVALACGAVQERLFDYAVLEPLVLALVIGLAVRALRPPPEVYMPGIGFAAKQLLEFAIVLLGASLNLRALVDAGSQILAAVLISVSLTLVAGVVLGRLAGLGTRLAVLIAVGNAICGNSAIAAVAPAIRAKKQEVASAIALTAVLGVGVVLLLPTLVPLFDLSNERYGVIGGLSVYAVPQVLAATIPVSAESGQIASLVKLTRVLLLGPVVALFAWLFRGPVTTTGNPQPVVPQQVPALVRHRVWRPRTPAHGFRDPGRDWRRREGDQQNPHCRGNGRTGPERRCPLGAGERGAGGPGRDCPHDPAGDDGARDRHGDGHRVGVFTVT